MKRFASLDTPCYPQANRQLVGRDVAIATFLEGLWRYARFDAYHFFAGDLHDRHVFEEAWRPLWESLGIADRVVVESRWHLLDRLHDTSFHVFHQGDFLTSWAELCHLRTRHARQPFPVTAPIHSISYPAYQEKLLRLMLPGPASFDAIVCTSRAGLKALETGFQCIQKDLQLPSQQVYPRMRLAQIPLGVDADHFRPPSPAEAQAARASLSLPQQVPIALCLGRFSASDKYDLLPLMRAFREACRHAEESPTAPPILVLAGARQGNNYPEQLLQLAAVMGLEHQVRTLVDVTPAQQLALYQAADVFVSPSDNLQETFGLTVLEAMACGLPVVASDWDGYRDMVMDEVTGFLIPTRGGSWDADLGELGPVSYLRPWHLAVAQGTAVDVPALAQALATLFASPGLRAELGQAARVRALDFAWKSVIERYEDLWDELHQQASLPPSRPGPSPFAQRPFTLFAAHPSHSLKDSDHLSLTELGLAQLRRPQQRSWYAELEALMDADLVRHLCAAFRRGLSVGEAVAEVQAASGVSETRIRYQVGWMLKQDLVRLGMQQG